MLIFYFICIVERVLQAVKDRLEVIWVTRILLPSTKLWAAQTILILISATEKQRQYTFPHSNDNIKYQILNSSYLQIHERIALQHLTSGSSAIVFLLYF